MLRFLHIADLHLDSPFAALPQSLAAERRRESREQLERLRDYVNQQGVELVLLAGDLFDSRNAYRDTCEQLARCLGTMRAQVVIAPGNHDWYGPKTAWTAVDWPENVHIFKEDHLTEMTFPQWDLVIHGAAFTGPEQNESLLAGFSAPRDGSLHIGLFHGQPEQPDSPYDPITREEIANSHLCYLALGHVHKRMEPRYFGETLCAWPGCPEGRGFDELGEKGFYLGTLGDNGRVALQFVPFARRCYQILEVDVTDRDPRQAVEDALPPDTVRDLYRILLTGETGESGADAAGIQAALAERFCTLEVRDQTHIAESLWARAEEDSLRGSFLREMHRRWQAAETPEEQNTVTMATRFGLAALDHRDI